MSVFITHISFYGPLSTALWTLPCVSSLVSSIQLSETILHVLVERRHVARVPPTQGWSAFRNICSSPHDPQLVDLASGFVVGNEDVEIASANPVDHEEDCLFGRPCTVRFIADSGCWGTCEPGVRPPRAMSDKLTKFWVERMQDLT